MMVLSAIIKAKDVRWSLLGSGPEQFVGAQRMNTAALEQLQLPSQGLGGDGVEIPLCVVVASYFMIRQEQDHPDSTASESTPSTTVVPPVPSATISATTAAATAAATTTALFLRTCLVNSQIATFQIGAIEPLNCF